MGRWMDARAIRTAVRRPGKSEMVARMINSIFDISPQCTANVMIPARLPSGRVVPTVRAVASARCVRDEGHRGVCSWLAEHRP